MANGYGTIEKFGTNGVGSVFAAGLNNPIGLAFDSSGNLFVACAGSGTIEEFDTNGVGTTFASGLNSPNFIAIQVPEPATWSLLALSVGVLLGSRRLRRRSS